MIIPEVDRVGLLAFVLEYKSDPDPEFIIPSRKFVHPKLFGFSTDEYPTTIICPAYSGDFPQYDASSLSSFVTYIVPRELNYIAPIMVTLGSRVVSTFQNLYDKLIPQNPKTVR